MKLLHLTLNLCCYVICQLSGFVAICLMNSTILEKYIAEFIFSLLFTIFYASVLPVSTP